VRACSVEDHLQWRVRVREDFLRHINSGLIARGFERDLRNAESRYLFAEDENQFNFNAYRAISTAGMYEINGAMIE
jgi:hypothetical protein